MKKMKFFLITLGGMVTVFLATVNVILNEKSPTVSNLILQNVMAFTQESGESSGVLDTSYNRHPFQCTVSGNGKIKVVGGSIMQVDGCLSFDGGLYCTSGGNATCSPKECVDVWHWIFD
jgi:hypothetical protein